MTRVGEDWKLWGLNWINCGRLLRWHDLNGDDRKRQNIRGYDKKWQDMIGFVRIEQEMKRDYRRCHDITRYDKRWHEMTGYYII